MSNKNVKTNPEVSAKNNKEIENKNIKQNNMNMENNKNKANNNNFVKYNPTEEEKNNIINGIRQRLFNEQKDNLITKQELTIWQNIKLFLLSIFLDEKELINQYKKENFNESGDIKNIKINDIDIIRAYNDFIKKKEEEMIKEKKLKKQKQQYEEQVEENNKNNDQFKAEVEKMLKEIIELEQRYKSKLKFTEDREIEGDELDDIDEIIEKTFSDIKSNKIEDIYELKVYLQEAINNKDSGLKTLLEERDDIVNELAKGKKIRRMPTLDVKAEQKKEEENKTEEKQKEEKIETKKEEAKEKIKEEQKEEKNDEIDEKDDTLDTLNNAILEDDDEDNKNKDKKSDKEIFDKIKNSFKKEEKYSNDIEYLLDNDIDDYTAKIDDLLTKSNTDTYKTLYKSGYRNPLTKELEKKSKNPYAKESNKLLSLSTIGKKKADLNHSFSYS